MVDVAAVNVFTGNNPGDKSGKWEVRWRGTSLLPERRVTKTKVAARPMRRDDDQRLQELGADQDVAKAVEAAHVAGTLAAVRMSRSAPWVDPPDISCPVVSTVPRLSKHLKSKTPKPVSRVCPMHGVSGKASSTLLSCAQSAGAEAATRDKNKEQCLLRPEAQQIPKEVNDRPTRPK